MLLLAVWLLATGKPSYYRPVDPQDAVAREHAAQLEQSLASQATRVRPVEAETWQMQVDQDQVNQWLATRLPQWLANQGVDTAELGAFNNLMVGFVDGNVELAAEARAIGLDSVLRLIYQPRDNGPQQPMTLELTGIASGHLPLPKQTVLDQLVERTPEPQRPQMIEARRMIEALDLSLPLQDGRLVSIVAMDFNETGVLLTCRTQRMPQARAAAGQ